MQWRRCLVTLTLVCTLLFLASKDLLKNKSLPKLRASTESIKSELIRRVPERKTLQVNCDAILKSDSDEIKKANTIMANFTRNGISDSDFIHLTSDCANYKRVRQFGFHEISEEEKYFPVAYSILLYKDVEQAERLLRSIYSVVNLYCFHVDLDSKPEVHKAIQGIADCFHNVFVVSRKEYIVYAGFSRLQADLNCMENLLQRKEKWKYFINLPSQQFPLKTNREIVEILKIYNGANDIEGLTGERTIKTRFKFRYIYKHVPKEVKPKIFKTTILKDSPPYNVTVVKASAYGIFSREFVEFVIQNRIARTILDWFRDVLSPDEYYWATLQYNPQLGTPGTFYKGLFLVFSMHMIHFIVLYWHCSLIS